jgi:amidohydrolase
MDVIEQRIIDLIDKNRETILDFAHDIYNHAELGYKEFRTSDRFKHVLQQLHMRVEDDLAITGVKGYLKEKENDITLALIGELDALCIPTHPHANKETEAAHCCGHHAQLAGVFGAALALSDSEILNALDGQVVFFAVPAEEYGEIAFKNQLKEQGKIKYGGGKSELIRIGAFDDIDLSIVHHTGGEGITIGSGTGNGFVSKVIRYIGKEAHAASSPENGINALNAASLGLSAVAYQRETFRDEDVVRVHPIITKGGNLVNVIPNEVVIETLVRGKTVDAIEDADKKTTRAFKAGAYAVGAGYVIDTMPGYLPTLGNEAHPEIVEAAKLAAPGIPVIKADVTKHAGGSTDVGDLQHIQPVLQFSTAGYTGDFHSSNFDIIDDDLAYITTAKIFALSAYRLLRNGAAEAKDIKHKYKAKFSKGEYLAYMDSKIKTEKREITE